ncbi:MAG TPA: DMT family transporter [bacterium]|nr:DMT family transporter [bacterium]
MTWLALAVGGGFFNALWTALSKKVLANQTPREFTLAFRAMTCLFLLPFAAFQWVWPLPTRWWLLALAAGVLEGLRIYLLTIGVTQDYYSTYAFFNLTAFFTVLLAPLFLPESQSLWLVLGGLCMAAGAFVFHRLGRWSWPGLTGALASTLWAIASKDALRDSPPLFFAFWCFGISAFILFPLDYLGGKPLRWKILGKHWKETAWVSFWSLWATVLSYLALAHAPASKVNPLIRSNLLFGFFFSYYLLGEKKGWRLKALGGGLIVAGLVLVALG